MSAPVAAPHYCATCGAPVRSNGGCSHCLLTAGLAQLTLAGGPFALSKPDARKVSEALGQSPGGIVATTLGHRLPERFDDFELIEEIAHGGMGVVYLARQLSLDRFVALKFLLPGRVGSAEMKERFRREAKAAAGLRHPNIVAVHHVGRLAMTSGSGETEEQPYFCMDFIEGRSLAEVLQHGPLSPERAARYCRTVAEAIHFAHERWVLHRDLKPSNVLIDLNDLPHITDFGLAGKMEVFSDLTLTGQMLGSPGYLPPEQAAGRTSQVSAASDIYSIGAILYECLVGRPPFVGANLQEILLRIRDDEVALPTLVNPAVPRDLETICLKCLAKNPSRRYATAQALADDLGRWLRHEPIQARPATLATQAGKWIRRNPWPSIAAIGVLLGLASFGTVQGVKSRQMREVTAANQARLALNHLQTGLRLAQEKDFATAALWLERAHATSPHSTPNIETRRAQLATEIAKTPHLLHLWAGPRLTDLRFSLDEEQIILTTTEGTVSARDLATGSATTPPSQTVANAASALPHPDGQRLLIFPTGKPIGQGLLTVVRDAAPIDLAVVSPSHAFLATANRDGITRVWDLRTSARRTPSPAEAEAAISHAIDPSDELRSLSRVELLSRWQR